MVATKPATRPHQAAFHIALRIRHPTIDPRAISAELNIEAEHAFMAGEPRESMTGLASASVHAESCWLATLNPMAWPSSPIAQADASMWGPRGRSAHDWLARNFATSFALCTAYLVRHAPFLHRLEAEGAQMVLRVALSPLALEGFSLSPQTTAALGKLGITVEFDFADPD
jgi:hypothetical protein